MKRTIAIFSQYKIDRSVFGLILSGAMLVTSSAIAAPTLVLAGTENIDERYRGWLKLIYAEALRRAGYGLELKTVPPKRASALADTGEVDGEIQRVESYGVDHPALIMVPTPHFSGAFAAYGTSALKLNDGWVSLQGSGFRVEYRAGIYRCEKMLTPIIPAQDLSVAYSDRLGLRKLLRQRSDLYIDLEISVNAALADTEFKNSGIRKIATMERADFHAFLHKRHADLVPIVSDALAQMKREGLIEIYRKIAYTPLRVIQERPQSRHPAPPSEVQR